MARPPASGDVFRAVADPTRRQIIDLLATGPMTAGALAEEFASCQSTVSEHLRILREAKLVAYTEDRGRRTYRLTPGPLRTLGEWSKRWAPTGAIRRGVNPNRTSAGERTGRDG